MNEITVDNIRDAVRKMNEMAIPRKVQEDLLLSQELYDQLKEHARPYVPAIDSMTICKFEGIVVRVDPELTGNQWRWDDSKAKKEHNDRLQKMLAEELDEENSWWYNRENMDMWRWYRNFFQRNP